jgi:hypothetical protein
MTVARMTQVIHFAWDWYFVTAVTSPTTYAPSGNTSSN